jgi:hypothetical protein
MNYVLKLIIPLLIGQNKISSGLAHYPDLIIHLRWSTLSLMSPAWEDCSPHTFAKSFFPRRWRRPWRRWQATSMRRPHPPSRRIITPCAQRRHSAQRTYVSCCPARGSAALWLTASRGTQYAAAEKEGRVASEKFLQAAQQIADKRTIDALVLLAENYEYRSKVARARNPAPPTEGEGEVKRESELKDTEDADELPSPTATVTPSVAENNVGGEESAPDTTDQSADMSAATEAQLNLAAVEMEELWRRLHEIGLSSGGSSDKVRFTRCLHLFDVNALRTSRAELAPLAAEQPAHVVTAPVLVAGRLVLPAPSQKVRHRLPTTPSMKADGFTPRAPARDLERRMGCKRVQLMAAPRSERR